MTGMEDIREIMTTDKNPASIIEEDKISTNKIGEDRISISRITKGLSVEDLKEVILQEIIQETTRERKIAKDYLSVILVTLLMLTS